MKCPKCGSENTKVELINKVKVKRKKNWFYWICFIWVYDLFLWVFFFLPRLILQLFKGKSYTTKNKTEKHLICNNCGYTGKIK